MIRLKDLRGSKTQLQIANQLNIPRETYRGYETGSRQPDPAMLIKMANYFGVTVDYLLGNDEVNKELPQSNNTVVSIGRGGERTVYEISDEDAAIVNAFIEKMAKKNN